MTQTHTPVPDVPWSALADWVKYVAMDENGNNWAYASKPISTCSFGCYCGWLGVGQQKLSGVKIDWKGLPWDETLTKRPEVTE